MPHGRTTLEEDAILQYLAGERRFPELTPADFAAHAPQSRLPSFSGHRPGGRNFTPIVKVLSPTVRQRRYLPISEPSQASEGLITDAVASEATGKPQPPRKGIAALKAETSTDRELCVSAADLPESRWIGDPQRGPDRRPGRRRKRR